MGTTLVEGHGDSKKKEHRGCSQRIYVGGVWHITEELPGRAYVCPRGGLFEVNFER